MYRGFNLSLKENCFTQDYFEKIQKIGSESFSNQRVKIIKRISSFANGDGSLDGTKMQENWFPQIKADIFISHSHEDEELALALAGYLKDSFELTAFIDSCVWGYANDLLKMIDNKYCYQKATKTYSYQKRNYSTSHVHMMLSVALTQMIDNTECLFFLNTPNSITPDTIINQTESPWIYSEIATSQLVRKKKLEEYRQVALMESQKTFSDGGELKFRYDLPTEYLTEINADTLETWEKSWSSLGPSNYKYPQYPENLRVHALDKLYELK